MNLTKVYQIFDSIQPDEYGCHQWPNVLVGYYGRAWISRGIQIYAHRLALERKLGRPIKPGLCALHTCDCKSCVNPDHLYEGTYTDNLLDAFERIPGYREQNIERLRLTNKRYRSSNVSLGA
jgi:hypothetical protein